MLAIFSARKFPTKFYISCQEVNQTIERSNILLFDAGASSNKVLLE
ncbi:hypothetical protein A1OE_801 [Candidatus Endolissoclinum faulkneri L2]|uniref:Uncharacterized protein n=1 Tax=Candidatus Endolissoclinum faulkneri L2 TaxID=1193729 RepID=K7ZCY0_9PROT|nr:hypothetical protein A1OE_801 [Candidatus Endolissoclinum faulkneri L2]